MSKESQVSNLKSASQRAGLKHWFCSVGRTQLKVGNLNSFSNFRQLLRAERARSCVCVFPKESLLPRIPLSRSERWGNPLSYLYQPFIISYVYISFIIYIHICCIGLINIIIYDKRALEKLFTQEIRASRSNSASITYLCCHSSFLVSLQISIDDIDLTHYCPGWNELSSMFKVAK